MIDRKTIFLALAFLAVLVLVALILPPFLNGDVAIQAASSVEVTRVIPQTVEVTQIVQIVVTATPIPPTPTPEATATLAPTPTPDSLAVLPEGFNPWCLPFYTAFPAAEVALTGDMPQAGQPGVVNSETGQMEMVIQVSSCTLMFTFNRPVPQGTTLNMYDLNPSPFLSLPMTIVSEHPEKAFVNLVNPYIVDPPFWSIDYQVEIVDPNAQVVWQEPVTFKRSGILGYCWNGTIPDPVTFKCNIPGGAHPWDPWFGGDYPTGYTPPGDGE
jgi:hypothetical protein